MDACAQRTDAFAVDDAQSVNPLLVTECDGVWYSFPDRLRGEWVQVECPVDRDFDRRVFLLEIIRHGDCGWEDPLDVQFAEKR